MTINRDRWWEKSQEDVKDRLFFSIKSVCYFLVGDFPCYTCGKSLTNRACTIYAHWGRCVGEVLCVFCPRHAATWEKRGERMAIYTKVVQVNDFSEVPQDALLTPISMFNLVTSRSYEDSFSAASKNDGAVINDQTRLAGKVLPALPHEPVKLIADNFTDDDPEGLLRALQDAKPADTPKYYLEDNRDRGGEV